MGVTTGLDSWALQRAWIAKTELNSLGSIRIDEIPGIHRIPWNSGIPDVFVFLLRLLKQGLVVVVNLYLSALLP